MPARTHRYHNRDLIKLTIETNVLNMHITFTWFEHLQISNQNCRRTNSIVSNFHRSIWFENWSGTRIIWESKGKKRFIGDCDHILKKSINCPLKFCNLIEFCFEKKWDSRLNRVIWFFSAFLCFVSSKFLQFQSEASFAIKYWFNETLWMMADWCEQISK